LNQQDGQGIWANWNIDRKNGTGQHKLLDKPHIGAIKFTYLVLKRDSTCRKHDREEAGGASFYANGLEPASELHMKV